jgi:tetratricopeptide (TPR) repeat protein
MARPPTRRGQGESSGLAGPGAGAFLDTTERARFDGLVTHSQLLDEARVALDQAAAEPAAAREVAASLSERARVARDREAQAVAERAVGLAALNLSELPEAVRHLRLAVRLADRVGSAQLAGEARMTLAAALVRGGSVHEALRQLDRAHTQLDDLGRARALAQRAAMNIELGRTEAGLADSHGALPALRRAEDHVWVQRVLLNRGVLQTLTHHYAAAAADLEEAATLAPLVGRPVAEALIQENLAFVRSRLGDVPAALRHGDAAERLYAGLGTPIGSLLMDRSELLLSVRLIAEAREAAERAVAECERSGRFIMRPEARLLLARSAMLDGDHAVAADQARRAAREFDRQGRSAFAALARYAQLSIQAEDPTKRRPPFPALAALADELEGAGWRKAALDARMLAGRTWLGTTRTAEAVAQLEVVGAARHTGPVSWRTTGWQARALACQSAGDRRGARRAALAGLRLLADYRTTMAATDLRARVSILGQDLADIGLRGALQSAASGGPAFAVLEWAERGRAQHLLHRPVHAPEDETLAALLGEVRSLVGAIDEAEGEGRPTESLAAALVRAERAVRDHMRRQEGASLALTETCPERDELTALLGTAALVELVVSDETVYAVSLTRGRAHVDALGSVHTVADLVRWLPFALTRLARSRTTPSGRVGAFAMLDHTARRLDDLLLGTVRRRIGDAPVVVVPTGPLQSLPWSLLPTMRGRPVTVAPSGALWSAAIQRPVRRGPVVVVAGPGLPGADREARDVAAAYGVVPLVGAAASVGAVSTAMRGAGLAHLAAHGTVRADNPLFSSLRLADGPLTVVDLERLDEDADTVVLAACESGRHVVLAGDELLGLGATMLSGDTRHLVASVVPVPDAETRALMTAFHDRLRSGETVAASLSQAQQSLDAEDPAAFAAAAGFICLGAGFGVPGAPIHQSGHGE